MTIPLGGLVISRAPRAGKFLRDDVSTLQALVIDTHSRGNQGWTIS